MRRKIIYPELVEGSARLLVRIRQLAEKEGTRFYLLFRSFSVGEGEENFLIKVEKLIFVIEHMNQEKFVVFRSIWFCWLFMTAVYILFGFSGYPKETISTPLGYIAGFFGLFVPYGLMSLILFVRPLTWVSLVIFVVSMIFADRKLNKANLDFGKRILLNLLILLALTTLVDLIRETPFVSWFIFFNGAHPRYMSW